MSLNLLTNRRLSSKSYDNYPFAFSSSSSLYSSSSSSSSSSPSTVSSLLISSTRKTRYSSISSISSSSSIPSSTSTSVSAMVSWFLQPSRTMLMIIMVTLVLIQLPSSIIAMEEDDLVDNQSPYHSMLFWKHPSNRNEQNRKSLLNDEGLRFKKISPILLLPMVLKKEMITPSSSAMFFNNLDHNQNINNNNYDQVNNDHHQHYSFRYKKPSPLTAAAAAASPILFDDEGMRFKKDNQLFNDEGMRFKKDPLINDEGLRFKKDGLIDDEGMRFKRRFFSTDDGFRFKKNPNDLIDKNLIIRKSVLDGEGLRFKKSSSLLDKEGLRFKKAKINSILRNINTDISGKSKSNGNSNNNKEAMVSKQQNSIDTKSNKNFDPNLFLLNDRTALATRTF
ncbi:hypothetical protein SSS_05267 [Sarcoptes scabiei]|uniref:Uncharacterized protein n=1 Tax=Sarcoptes scabiei TaxID=52283 RepID=A0A834V9I9_SARSC|nr:hypothetical protein SSS_05267 [Sarcoptes scabiei]UXI14391.1 hypothetical protein NH340_JMT00334 [Sarcoptes scabiei]